MSYRDYSNAGFENYNNAYVNEPKVRINFEKFAEDLYRWKKNNKMFETDKPQIENYLIISEAPSTYVAKSSLSHK